MSTYSLIDEAGTEVPFSDPDPDPIADLAQLMVDLEFRQTLLELGVN